MYHFHISNKKTPETVTIYTWLLGNPLTLMNLTRRIADKNSGLMPEKINSEKEMKSAPKNKLIGRDVRMFNKKPALPLVCHVLAHYTSSNGEGLLPVDVKDYDPYEGSSRDQRTTAKVFFTSEDEAKRHIETVLPGRHYSILKFSVAKNVFDSAIKIKKPLKMPKSGVAYLSSFVDYHSESGPETVYATFKFAYHDLGTAKAGGIFDAVDELPLRTIIRKSR